MIKTLNGFKKKTYVGYTKNIKFRLDKHNNNKGAKSTKGYIWELIYKKKFTTAYKLTSKHGLTEGPEFADAEWMSGWIALSFLNNPLLAKDHFQKFYMPKLLD